MRMYDYWPPEFERPNDQRPYRWLNIFATILLICLLPAGVWGVMQGMDKEVERRKKDLDDYCLAFPEICDHGREVYATHKPSAERP